MLCDVGQIWSDKKIFVVSVCAATVTVIAGILHLMMGPRSFSHNVPEGILFLAGGALQVFWALPVMKRWGRTWQVIGIVGTGVFVLLYALDRFHLIPEQQMPSMANHTNGGPMGGGPPGQFGQEVAPRSGRTEKSRSFIGGTAMPIEIAQILFIGLYLALAKMIANRKSA